MKCCSFFLGNSYIAKSDLYEAINKYTKEEIEKEKYQDVLNMLYSEKKVFIDEANNIYDYSNIEVFLMLFKLAKK